MLLTVARSLMSPRAIGSLAVRLGVWETTWSWFSVPSLVGGQLLMITLFGMLDRYCMCGSPDTLRESAEH